MRICVDIETKGLDARKFVAACVTKQNYVSKIFYSKEDTWNYILELGDYCLRNKKVLNVYAHNHAYDFLGYAPIGKDKNIKIYNDNNPFIVSYQDANGKEYIKFLDSMALFPFSLKKLGDIVGVEKGVLPHDFKQTDGKSIQELQQDIKNNTNNCRDYMVNDTVIVLKGLDLVKSMLKKDGVIIKRLYTVSQLAISYVMNKLQHDEKLTLYNFWYNKKMRMVHRTRFAKEIHASYRGPKISAFKQGVFSTDTENDNVSNLLSKGVMHHPYNVSYIDVNSLYPYAICNMDIPNLLSERKIKNPLNNYTAEYILSKIGVSRIMMQNIYDDDGLIPIRTSIGNMYPGPGNYVIGTYTHNEIRAALNNGYKVMKIIWTILYDNLMYNPFKSIFEHLYENKTKDDGFERYFYKSIMNHSIGKMAQFKPFRDYILDSVENAESYLDNNYKIVSSKGYNYLFKKDIDKYKHKNYYMPIIPSLVNSYARVYMYEQIKKVPYKDRIYTDTDSLIFRHRNDDNLNLFKISDKMGEFKVVYKDVNAVIYGRKTYAIGNDFKISGMRKGSISMDDFMKGYVTAPKMVSLKSAQNIDEAGSFTVIARDLVKQYDDSIIIKKRFSDQKIFIDEDINDIQEFTEDIKSIRD